MYKTVASLVLASQSPRRRQLLGQLGIKFSLSRADIEESQFVGEEPAGFVTRMAREKALAVAADFPESWILTADTIVVLEGKILGKPADECDAIRMLTAMAGGWHQVLTAFTLQHTLKKSTITRLDSSRVKIVALSESQVEAYIKTGEPLDKAGSYAVQGIGGAFVEAIAGSPTTVIGLPLPLLVPEMLNLQIISV